MTLKAPHKRIIKAALALLCALALCSCARADNEIYDASGLATGRVAVIMGTTGESYVKNELPDARPFVYTSETDALAALLAGKVDYIMCGISAANVMAGSVDGIAVLGEHYQVERIAMAVDKSNAFLLNSINARLYDYRTSGRLDEIVSHWLKSPGEEYDMVETPSHDVGETLVVGTTGDLEPTSFIADGKMVGLDAELIENIAYDLGYRVEYAVMDFDALLPALVSGKIDIVASDLTVTEERAQAVCFTDTCYTDYQVLVVRDKNALAQQVSARQRLATLFENSFVREGRWRLILEGLGVTLLLAVLSALLGTALAVGLCAMRISKRPALRGFARVFIAAVQGMPVVVLLLIVCYVIFKWAAIGSLAVAVAAFSVYFSTYAAETMRAGLESVDIGQREAALALGYSSAGMFRRVVLPQAARFALPLYKQELVSLIKVTSVAGYIAIEDLTKAGDIIRSRTYEAFFPLIIVAAIYFLITWLLSLALDAAQIRLDPRRRRDAKLRAKGANHPRA